MAKVTKLPLYFTRALAIIAAAIVVVLLGALAAYPITRVGPLATYQPPWSADENLDLAPLAQNSYVYAVDGSLLATLHAEENRIPVELTGVAPAFTEAVLAAEDNHFYEHSGVNVKAIARAMLVNINRGSISQGGSTITQQVVLNSFLTREKSYSRKLKEAVLARKLEQKMTKNEILERYINTIYLGNGAYGVRAAADIYFNKQPQELSVAESAMLAGMIRSPSDTDPLTNPQNSQLRRSEVLEEMVYLKQIDGAAKQAAEAEPLPTTAHHKEQIIYGPGDYFAEWVKQVLLKEDTLGETPTQRYNALFKGGLKIETTLDPRLQKLAEQAVDTTGPHGSIFTASIASVDTKTGAVRAIVGGRDFKSTKYNLATQSIRSTGSSFKIFTLVAAFSHGVSPDETIDGTGPCNLKIPGGGTWKANNNAGEGGGVMSVRSATAHSVNCAFARLILKVGVDRVVDIEKAMGLPPPYKAVPSITLGTQEESPVDMAGAVATLPRGGIRQGIHYVERIIGPDGAVVFEQSKEGEQTVDKCVALTAVDVLRGVVTGGTGTRASIGRQPVAGKTGTGEKFRDAWFVGFTPHLSTAVWVGSPEGEITIPGGYGGTVAAPVFRAFMEPAHENVPVEDFEKPDCKLKSGGLKGPSDTPAPGSGGGGAPQRTAASADQPAAAPPPPDTTEPPAPPVTSPPTTTSSSPKPAPSST